ncbi:MAG: hypothetical protein Q4G19_00490 [Clostridia bacterium]|nr:hypothetical protein [Clostridia bacterium]
MKMTRTMPEQPDPPPDRAYCVCLPRDVYLLRGPPDGEPKERPAPEEPKLLPPEEPKLLLPPETDLYPPEWEPPKLRDPPPEEREKLREPPEDL